MFLKLTSKNKVTQKPQLTLVNNDEIQIVCTDSEGRTTIILKNAHMLEVMESVQEISKLILGGKNGKSKSRHK